MQSVMPMGRKNFNCDPEMPYHITARCINKEWFSASSKDVWSIMTTHLYFISFAYNIRIHAFVLMTNHFHLIAQAPDANLSEAMRFFMSECGRDLRQLSNRINCTFGTRFHRSRLGNPHYYFHAYKYLYRNPVEAGLCTRVEDYPYSTLPGLLGKSKIEVPIIDDFNWSSAESRFRSLEWLNLHPQRDDWEKVKKGLRRSEFRFARENSKPSHLETNRL